ncbi:hypothetical protein [Paenibacillus sp. FSL H8-0537]|uniref:hypothetical protein n=1 Tax=Paenibacillus sp. FSL H8-0537 TaxID=2921399 RepID=UPI0031019760
MTVFLAANFEQLIEADCMPRFKRGSAGVAMTAAACPNVISVICTSHEQVCTSIRKPDDHSIVRLSVRLR